ncbi:MAG: amidase [Gammaproteobacteria bacterium]|nr:amidase [Gammaproteobacteria bacterium]
MSRTGSAQSRVDAGARAIAACESTINALITDCVDDARDVAALADRAQAAGHDGGLLAGVTMLIKDNINTAGLRTTSGSRFFSDFVPNQDAPVVARLRAAGAIIMGKSTLHEFAFGIRSNNSVSGQCLNPWDLARVPGGSSGGSGASVAANYCVGALGSDTGGSVRLPAAFCGISGLRPTVGRVTNAGSMPVCPSQDTIGPMARSVLDVAKMLAVIAEPDSGPGMQTAQPLGNFLPTLEAGVEGVRIGIPRNMYFDDVEASIGACIEASMKQLEQLGAQLVPVDVPDADSMHQWATIVIFSDACELHAERLRNQPGEFDDQVRERMLTGQSFTGVDYARAMRARERWRETLADVFSRVDVMLSPAVHTQVPPVADDKSLLEATKAATRNTYAGAFGQIPGLSIPCGFSTDGLPVGLQLEAKWWNEPTLLRVGRAFQRESDWHLRVAPHGGPLLT